MPTPPKSPSRALAAAALAVAGLCSLVSGCGKTPSSSLIVRIVSDAPVTEVFDQVIIQADRADSNALLKYYLRDELKLFPGTLTLEVNPNGDTDVSKPVVFSVEASLSDAAGHRNLVRRSFSATFAGEHTKFVQLALRYSCFDFQPPNGCPSGTTCRAGACVESGIDPDSLPDVEDAFLAPVAGACFDLGPSGASCFAHATDVAARDLTLVAEGHGCSFASPIAPGPSGRLNIALEWLRGAGCLVPLEQDAVEGWTFADGGAASGRIHLPAGLCADLAPRGDGPAPITTVRFSSDCAPKTSDEPFCANSPDATANGGAAGPSTNGKAVQTQCAVPAVCRALPAADGQDALGCAAAEACFKTQAPVEWGPCTKVAGCISLSACAFACKAGDAACQASCLSPDLCGAAVASVAAKLVAKNQLAGGGALCTGACPSK